MSFYRSNLQEAHGPVLRRGDDEWFTIVRWVLFALINDVHDLSQLNGATICAVKGTTHETNLADYFRLRNWRLPARDRGITGQSG